MRLGGKVFDTIEGGTLSYSFTNLTYSSNYSVSITAVNPIGAATSPTVDFSTTARPVAAPLTPLGVTVTDITTGTATVNWSASASQGDNTIDRTVVSYEVRRSGTLVATVNASTFTANLTGLTYSTSYNATVTAVNTAGGTATLPVGFNTAARTVATPNAPTNVTATNITVNSATITWNAPVNQGDNNTDRTVASYDVILNGSLNKNVSAATTSTVITELILGSTYTVSIVSKNSVGSSVSPTVTFNIAPISATGGTITQYTAGGVTYRVHTFSNVGTNSFTVNSRPSGAQVEYLVVGGGGGDGTGRYGGGCGGGAGGVRDNALTVGVQTYEIIVGAGGVGGNSSNYSGTNGGLSRITGVTTAGGGGRGTLGNGGGGERRFWWWRWNRRHK